MQVSLLPLSKPVPPAPAAVAEVGAPPAVAAAAASAAGEVACDTMLRTAGLHRSELQLPLHDPSNTTSLPRLLPTLP
jgi:hypothetical protein